MKINHLLFASFMVSGTLFAQDYKSFVYEYNAIKSGLHSDMNNLSITEVHELKSKFYSANKDAKDLMEDIEDYMDVNRQKPDYDNKCESLYNEIKDFEDFTEGQKCECLFNFSKIISDLGGSLRIIEQKEDIRILVSEIGNFQYYFAYSRRQEDLYEITINAKDNNWKSSMGFPNREITFGLMKEIDGFLIEPKQNNFTYLNCKIVLKMKDYLNLNKTMLPESICPEDFPRW